MVTPSECFRSYVNAVRPIEERMAYVTLIKMCAHTFQKLRENGSTVESECSRYVFASKVEIDNSLRPGVVIPLLCTGGEMGPHNEKVPVEWLT